MDVNVEENNICIVNIVRMQHLLLCGVQGYSGRNVPSEEYEAGLYFTAVNHRSTLQLQLQESRYSLER